MKTEEATVMQQSPDAHPPDRVSTGQAAAPPLPPPVQEPLDAEVGGFTDGQKPRRKFARTRRFFGGPLAVLRFVGSAVEWSFGVVSMIMILAVLATVPIAQMLSLGYLLEVAGRVARSGRLRDGFIGIRTAARVGGIALGTSLFVLPILFVSSLWYDAWLIDPASAATRNMRAVQTVVTAVLVAHILWAWFRGGRLRHFLWPAPIRFFKRVRRGAMYTEARDAVWDFVTGLRLRYYFWLGLRGFVGALAWLFIPATLLAVTMRLPDGANVAVGLLGGLLLATVLLYLPFLQTQLAVENRFGAMFEWRAVRQMFRRAPIAFWFALLITLLFALPLYLLKIELTPREVAWLPSVVFVVFIFPARLLTGWAVGRARRRDEPRHFVFRWAARLAAFPVVGIYALITFFSQYLLWYGAFSIYEQHAFLVPVPFLGM
jgi:hypothetical protein